MKALTLLCSLTSARARGGLLVLALAGTAGAQTTWRVDDDGPFDPFPGVSDPLTQTFSDPAEDGSAEHPFDDLWKAVDAAANGDEVLVLPSNVTGAYFLPFTLDLQGKAITVRSQGGAALTVLDGTTMPGDPGVSFDQGESSGTVFEGFTLRNFDRGSGTGATGGAIEVLSSSPTIRGCRLEANHAYVGAALYTSNASPLVEDCTFAFNDSVHQGGAVYTSNGSPTFSRCAFEGNTADYGGAFLSRTNGSSQVRVQDCLFLGNGSRVGYAGALAKFDAGTIEVRRTRFLGNVAKIEGGGVYLSGGGLVSDCTFNSNGSLAGEGGGLSVGTAGNHFVHGSTFHANTGGGVHENGNPVFLTLANCIVWNNTPYEVVSNVSVSHCDVLGGYAGAGNLDVDPLFVDASGPDDVLGTLDDDLSLFQGSPCIDAGDTAVLAVGYPADLNGRPRAVDVPSIADTGVALVGLTTDMGAFEFQGAGRLQRFRR